jgi:hypothetical protein
LIGEPDSARNISNQAGNGMVVCTDHLALGKLGRFADLPDSSNFAARDPSLAEEPGPISARNLSLAAPTLIHPSAASKVSAG